MLFHRSHPVAVLVAIALSSIVAPFKLGGQPGNMVFLDTPAVSGVVERRSSWISLNREGILIANQDHSTNLIVHGYTQADSRFFLADMQDRSRNVLLFRRVRPLVEGKLTDQIEFRFMPDFGEGNTVLQEAYLEWDPVGTIRLRLGKFKSPIGLEALRSDRDLTFPERSLASDFVPLRDLGIQVETAFLNESLVCQAGYFSGAQDGTNAEFEWEGAKEGVARVFGEPFARSQIGSLRELGLGISGSVGNNHSSLPSFKTIGQQTFFSFLPNVGAAGLHSRASPQVYYFKGSFGALYEHVISNEGVQSAAQHCEINNTGWQIAASFVLTGERNTYNGIQLSHAFEPTHAITHPGAWEIAFRHSGAQLDGNAFPRFADPARSARGAHEFAGGLSWYVNHSIKFMSFYESTTFPKTNSIGTSLVPERLLITRVQLAF